MIRLFADEFDVLNRQHEERFHGEGWTAEVWRRSESADVEPPDYERPRAVDEAALARRIGEAPSASAAQRTFAATTLARAMFSEECASPRGRAGATKGLDPLTRGDLVHRYFELWDFGGSPPEVESFLRLEAPGPRFADSAREALRNAAEQFKGSEARKLLVAAKDIQREVPFLLRVCDVLVNGTIDALLDGEWILDYKTGRSDGPGAAAYEAQLRLYAAAVRDLLGRAPREAHLYYVDTGELKTVDVSEGRIAETLAMVPAAVERLRVEASDEREEALLR
jgi:ATP-dependent exoDNAse (exonuclease V) beta subunit